MFVSSYNTYISANSQNRGVDERSSERRKDSSFKSSTQLPQETRRNKSLNLPIDYVINSKSFGNKLEIERQEQELQTHKEGELSKSKELTKEFTSNITLKSAELAYKEGSSIFALLRKTHPAIDQTPTIDKNLPNETQELQEQNMRHIMVNTYLSNDRYYQITA